MLRLLKITVACCSRDVALNKLSSQARLTWMDQSSSILCAAASAASQLGTACACALSWAKPLKKYKSFPALKGGRC